MPVKPASIVIISGPMAGSEIRLKKELLTLGRSDNASRWKLDIGVVQTL